MCVYTYMCVEREKFCILICWKEEVGKKEDLEESLSIAEKLLCSNLFCCPSYLNVMLSISGEKNCLQYTSIYKIQDA